MENEKRTERNTGTGINEKPLVGHTHSIADKGHGHLRDTPTDYLDR